MNSRQLAMAVDDGFEGAGKVSVKRGCGGVGLRERDRFRKQAAGMRFC